MDRARKRDMIEKMESDLPEAQSIILTNHTGIDVNTVNELRAEFRANDVHYHVVKNTLAKIAIEDTEVEPLSERFRYPTAVAYSFDDAVVPAKIALDFAEDHEDYEVKCGFLKGTVLEPEDVESLADMPSKDELRGKLVNTLASVPKEFLSLLETPGRKFVNTLDARKDDLEEA